MRHQRDSSVARVRGWRRPPQLDRDVLSIFVQDRLLWLHVCVHRLPGLPLIRVFGDRQSLTETTNRLASIILPTAAILLLSTFPGWHSEYSETGSEAEAKPFPSRLVSHLVAACLVVSTIFSGISVLWQHIAAVAVATSTTTLIGGAVKSHVGTASMVLAWAATFLLAISTFGVLLMIVSIALLDKLTDDD